MERSETPSMTMHKTVTLISGLGLGLGVAVAALSYYRKRQEEKATSVDSILEKCRNAACHLESRIEHGFRKAS